MWKVLLVSDLPTPSRLVEYDSLISAIYNEKLDRVDVFMESDSASYILRFITIPTPKLGHVFSAVNDENVQFGGVRGPKLHYIGEHLIVTGSKRDDFQEIFRIFQAAINEERNTFTLVPVWNSGRSAVEFSNHVVTSAKRLFILAISGEVLCFTPNLGDGVTQWPEPIVTTHPWKSGRIMLGALRLSADASDTCSIIPQLRGILEDNAPTGGHMPRSTVLAWHSLEDEKVYLSSDIGKLAVASSTHLLWIRDTSEEPAIASAPFNVPSLQYLCLSKLCSTMEAYRQCKSEEEALRLGIPILAWRRYCK